VTDLPQGSGDHEAASSGYDLSAEEVRVLGCLVEKDRTTPQNYPLTLNALRLACNQTTNREPVVDYDDATVEQALALLRGRGLTRVVYSTSNRATKYRHVLDEALALVDAEVAALCVLALRGPQTAGEVKGRSERLHAFTDLGEVQTTLDGLADRDPPLAVRLERRPGQKDARYAHLLAGPVVDDPAPPAERRPAPSSPSGFDSVRAELEDLRAELATLRAEFDAFRSQF
jgi:hypothetical protein